MPPAKAVLAVLVKEDGGSAALVRIEARQFGQGAVQIKQVNSLPFHHGMIVFEVRLFRPPLRYTARIPFITDKALPRQQRAYGK